MGILVAVENIEKAFSLTNGSEYIALNGIDLQIKKGEFVSLIDHSGCGQSTLSNMVVGLSLPTKGFVTIDMMELRYAANKFPGG